MAAPLPDHLRTDTFDSKAAYRHRRGLVDALHCNLRPLVTGALMGVVTAILCAWRTGDGTYVGFALAIAVVMVVRIAFRHLYLRSAARREPHDAAHARVQSKRLNAWRAATIVLGAAATLLLGSLAFHAITSATDLFTPFAATVLAFGNAVGVTGRSFGSRLLARMQAATLYLPVAAALVLEGSTEFLVLGSLIVLFALLVVEVSDGQHLVLDGALRDRARSETLSRQLSIALETTPNGALLFDAAGTLQLWNDQAAALLTLLPGERGCLAMPEVEARLRQHFEPVDGAWTPLGPFEEACEVRSRAADDFRSFDIRSRRNDTGELFVRIDDVTEARQAERRITHLARFDGLTGLANRAWFFSRGEAMLPPAAPDATGGTTQGVCVATLDIDRLRTVNETHGHAVADAVLNELGSRLSRVAGAERLCARLGGDDFAVLSILEGPQGSDVTPLRGELEDASTFTLDTRNGPIAVTGAIGLCVDTGSGLSLDELIERADYAQALAKQSGHAHSAVFEAGMEESFNRTKRLREDLALAIREKCIRTVFQPIWSVEANGPISFEALARWTHDVFGPVPPNEFVRLAEENGLVGDLTRLQLDAATRFCAACADDISVSVNLSAHDFAGGTVRTDIADALARAGLDPARLVVEVTETSLLELGPETFATFEAIRGTGVRIALDDFGTGYSSLSYLQRLQLDIVKIDRAFLSTLHEGTRTANVLAAVSRLAEGLAMDVVVEGVETPEQMEILNGDLGFDLIQGYLFGAPMPAAAARTLLQRSRPNGERMNEAPALSDANGDTGAKMQS